MEGGGGNSADDASSDASQLAGSEPTPSWTACCDEQADRDKAVLAAALCADSTGSRRRKNLRDLHGLIEHALYGQLRNREVAKIAGIHEKDAAADQVLCAERGAGPRDPHHHRGGIQRPAAQNRTLDSMVTGSVGRAAAHLPQVQHHRPASAADVGSRTGGAGGLSHQPPGLPTGPGETEGPAEEDDRRLIRRARSWILHWTIGFFKRGPLKKLRGRGPVARTREQEYP